MELSIKLQIFSQCFSAFFKSASNFDDFEKKDEPHSLCMYEVMDCKMCGYLNA